jgi:hypothetical protein
MRDLVATALVGIVFGFALHRVGFTDWSQVHAMFAFTDLRLLLGFMLAVALLAGSWLVIARVQHPKWAPRRLHPGTIPGGILFGAGWALCGSCPSAALASLGSGRWLALVTLAGVLVGNFVYPLVHARLFRWSVGSCADD